MRFQNILCPVDRSAISRRALDYAVVIGRTSGARVRVLEVIEIAQPPLPARQWAAFHLTDEWRAACLKELDRFVNPAGPNPVVSDLLLAEGQVAAEVLAEAAVRQPDLIVMGTHGRGGFERFVLGSVTEKVLRKAACPVLVVPPGDTEVPAREPFGTVVCGVDFSTSSPKAYEQALHLTRSGGRLLLVHVVDWPFGDSDTGLMPPAIDDLRRSLESSGKELLHALAASDSRELGLQVDEIVTCGKPSRDILQCARANSADLIVMGAHGRDAIGLGWLGSTTHRVIHGAACPVLTVRTAGNAAT